MHKSKLAGCVAFVVMLLTQGCEVSTTPATADRTQLVAVLTKQGDDWDKAIVRKDRAAIEMNMAEDFRQIDNQGNVYEKKAFVDDLVSSDIEIHPYTVEDFDVRVYGDVALLSGATKMTGTYKNVPFASHYRYIDVYARRNGVWQIVSVQTSPIPSSMPPAIQP